MNRWWVYIIQCRNKSLYTGISTDVERRFDEHQNDDKKASKYCARLRPLKLVYKSSAYKNKSDASKEEYRIKQLSRKDKLNLIKTNL
tara:strand:+ start:1017 stop:1277 length:261 start_codon:yes stop_codon:yes gene_type:complete